MNCERCHVEPATVFLTQIVNGQKMEVHLCQKCAKEQESELFNNNPSFQKFLSGLLDTSHNANGSARTQENMSCPTCGMTIAEFKKTSKIGCGQCYQIFENELTPILKRLHGSIVHTGKRPLKLDVALKRQKKVKELESELKIALMQEEYETAARLRDEIRALKMGGDDL